MKDIYVNELNGGRNWHSTEDIINFDSATIIIHRNNLKKYLEKYNCVNEDELKDTMWLNHGIIVKVIY